MEYLFSYGTLQLKKVQLKTFGRVLEGKTDDVQGYIFRKIKIENRDVLRVSQKSFHPILIPSTKKLDRLAGTVFKLTPSELNKEDSDEVDDFRQIKVILKSRIERWVYVSKQRQEN